MDEEPLLENIFGKPNLFAAMPDLMSQLSRDAPTGFHEVLPAIPQVGGLTTPALGGLSTPVSGLPAPASTAMPAPVAAPATSRMGVASYTPPPAACFTPPSLLPTAEVGRTASRGLSLEGYYSTGGMAAATMNTASTAVPTPQVPGSYTYSTPSPFTYSQAQPQSALGSNLNAASYTYSSGTPFTGYSQPFISGQTSQGASGADLASYTYTAPSYTTSAAPASLTSYTQQGQIMGTTAQKALNADLSAGAYTYTTSAPTALFTGYSQPGQSTGAYGARLATPSYQPPYQVLS